MAQYKCQTGGLIVDDSEGVFDTIRGLHIPNDIMNRHWEEYLDWKNEGNVPDPQYTQSEWDNLQDIEEVADLTEQLKSAVVWQFRMILALFQVGRDKGIWTVNDFSPEIVAKAQNWKTKVDRLAELGE